MPKIINDGYGNTCSGNIWKEFMTKIHDGLEIKDFVPYVTEDGILSNGEETSESQATDETTENEENSIYTDENGAETTPISTDAENENNPDANQNTQDGSESNNSGNALGDNSGNNSDNASSNNVGNTSGSGSGNSNNRDNRETTNPYNSQVTKPSNEQAPGGADGGVYQEYWGD